MVKKSQVALHVRVKLNEEFTPKCLCEEHLIKDKIIWIAEEHIYNDSIGEYVNLKGYTESDCGINYGYAYLNQLDLEFPIEF